MVGFLTQILTKNMLVCKIPSRTYVNMQPYLKTSATCGGIKTLKQQKWMAVTIDHKTTRWGVIFEKTTIRKIMAGKKTTLHKMVSLVLFAKNRMREIHHFQAVNVKQTGKRGGGTTQRGGDEVRESKQDRPLKMMKSPFCDIFFTRKLVGTSIIGCFVMY